METALLKPGQLGLSDRDTQGRCKRGHANQELGAQPKHSPQGLLAYADHMPAL